MKIEKEEIKRIANNIEIDISDEEIEVIGESIEQITKTLDDMLDLQTSEERKIMGNEQVSNIFSSNEFDAPEDIIKSSNNFDGEYISVNKLEGFDE